MFASTNVTYRQVIFYTSGIIFLGFHGSVKIKKPKAIFSNKKNFWGNTFKNSINQYQSYFVV